MSGSYNILTARSQFIFTGATVTNTGTLTFPTITTTIVGRNTTDALTNKTITSSTMNDSTNTVGANNLYNGATWSIPLGGPAPSDGQVLTYSAAGTNIQFSSGGATSGSGTTTTAAPTVIQTVPTATNTVYEVTTVFVAKRTDAAVEGFSGEISAGFKNVAGTVTQIGGTGNTAFTTFSDTGVSDTWTVNFVITGTNITVSVTGQVAKTISWVCYSTVRSV
jgi:hypothetical protein